MLFKFIVNPYSSCLNRSSPLYVSIVYLEAWFRIYSFVCESYHMFLIRRQLVVIFFEFFDILQCYRILDDGSTFEIVLIKLHIFAHHVMRVIRCDHLVHFEFDPRRELSQEPTYFSLCRFTPNLLFLLICLFLIDMDVSPWNLLFCFLRPGL